MTRKLEPIPPGEILAIEFLEPRGLSQTRLAHYVGVPVSRIGAVVRGERAIDADLALPLAARFGTSADMWLRLQTDYDLRVARGGDWPKEERRIKERTG